MILPKFFKRFKRGANKERNKNEFKFVDVFSLYDGTSAGFPLMIKTSPKKGPVVFLTGVIHGEEVIGMEIIHRIFKSVRIKCGAVYAIPVCNLSGLGLGSRFLPYGEQTKWDNMNRAFPGNANGLPAERLADSIYKTIVGAKPDLVIDIHADSHSSVPYVLIDRFVEKERDQKIILKTKRLAEEFGVTVCNEEPVEDYLADYGQNSLTGALYNFAKIPAISVELGGDYFIKESFARTGTNGIKNILHELGMLDEEWTPEVFKNKIKTSYPLRILNISGAFQSGKISYKAKLGEKIQNGEVIATVEDVFGQTKEVIKSPADGYLIYLGDRILHFPGLNMASLAVKDENPS